MLSRSNQKTQKKLNKIKVSLRSFQFEKTWSLQDFQILKQLGKGRFGTVIVARQKQSDYVVAIKRMEKAQLQQNDFTKQVRREIIIQSTLKHDHVLKLFGYFWDQKNIYLILQYASGGELYRILKERKYFTQRQVSIIIRQVCQGLQYLHSKNIIHRDIKPQNLLLSLGKVKIADFGWSIHTEVRRDTLCGTLDYLAPEMVKGHMHDSSIDMWGLGILAYQLAVGNPPFETNSYQATYQKIIKEQVIFPKHLSWQARSFIGSLLRKCPKKRMTVNEALQDEFILAYRSENLSF